MVPHVIAVDICWLGPSSGAPREWLAVDQAPSQPSTQRELIRAGLDTSCERRGQGRVIHGAVREGECRVGG